GWLRHQENAAKPPKRRRRGGQFGATVRFRRSDHPVRSNKGSFAIFLLMSRPPLLCKEGNRCFPAGNLCELESSVSDTLARSTRDFTPSFRKLSLPASSTFSAPAPRKLHHYIGQRRLPII